MSILGEFLKFKTEHIIARYGEDDEPCFDCARGGATRATKKKYAHELVTEMTHHGERKHNYQDK